MRAWFDNNDGRALGRCFRITGNGGGGKIERGSVAATVGVVYTVVSAGL